MQHRELSSLVFATLELSSLLNYKKKNTSFFFLLLLLQN